MMDRTFSWWQILPSTKKKWGGKEKGRCISGLNLLDNPGTISSWFYSIFSTGVFIVKLANKDFKRGDDVALLLFCLVLFFCFAWFCCASLLELAC
jgi:hypothetical protein